MRRVKPAARYIADDVRDTIFTGPPKDMPPPVGEKRQNAAGWTPDEVRALVEKMKARREAKAPAKAPEPKPLRMVTPLPAAPKGGTMDDKVQVRPLARGGLVPAPAVVEKAAAEVINTAITVLDSQTAAPVPTRGPVQFGGVDLAALTAIQALAESLSGANHLPKHIRSKADMISICMAGHELGIPAMTALRTIHLIEGRPELSADMMLGLTKRAGYLVRWLESTDRVATIQLVDPRDPQFPHTETFTMQMAVAAGLATKQVWRQYPNAMLRARAASAAVRAYCPEILASCYVEGEISDARPEPAPLTEKDFSHRGAAAPEAYTRFKGQKEIADAMREELEAVRDVRAFHEWAYRHREDFKALTDYDASTALWDAMRRLRVSLVGDIRPCPLTAATLHQWVRGNVDAPADAARIPDGAKAYRETKAAVEEARVAPVTDEVNLVNDWILHSLSKIRAEGVLAVWCDQNGYRFCRLGAEQRRAWHAVLAAVKRINDAAGEERVTVDDVRQWLRDAPEIPEDRMDDSEFLDDPELNEV